MITKYYSRVICGEDNPAIMLRELKKLIEDKTKKNKYNSKDAEQQEWQSGYYNALRDLLDELS